MSGFGKKILLTYGGGSIKKIGLYDKVKELLKDSEIYAKGSEPLNNTVQSRLLFSCHNIIAAFPLAMRYSLSPKSLIS